jgi:hypothetical protein
MKDKTAKKISRQGEIASLLNRALELMYRERVLSAGDAGERYQMWQDWHSRVEDVRMEMTGVLGIEYVNRYVEKDEFWD